VLRKCWSERCGAGCGPRLAGASWLASQFHRCWCATAPAKLHKKALYLLSVSRSCLTLCQPALRALRVNTALFMQNCLRWSGLVSRLRSPVCSSPTRRRLPPSWLCWHLSISQLLRKLFQSAASPCIWCLPPPLRPTLCARSFLTSRLPGPSLSPPPKGAGPVPTRQAAGTLFQ
jgi:hypothetical protein